MATVIHTATGDPCQMNVHILRSLEASEHITEAFKHGPEHNSR